MRLKHVFSVLVATILLGACGGGGAPAARQAAAPTRVAAPSENAAVPTQAANPSDSAAPPFSDINAGLEAGTTDGTGTTANPPAAQQPATQRLVIKNATVALQVENVSAAEAQIRARADQLGGYVVSVQTSGSDAYLTSEVIFRVPSARFEEALSGVEGLARKVLSRMVGGEDVTEEYVDLESRLRNLDATRTRLLDLLAKATQVDDALQVSQALTEVQGQIEQIQGRMKYLSQSAAFSTITASLQAVPPPPTIYPEESWQPLRIASQALSGLLGFGQGLVNLGIVLLIWVPVWLPLLLLGRWGWRRFGGRRTRKIPPAPPANPSA